MDAIRAYFNTTDILELGIIELGVALLFAWLMHRFVPVAYGRSAFAAVLLLGAAAFIALFVGFGEVWRAERVQAELLMLTVLAALDVAIVFLPSLFKFHAMFLTVVIAPFVWIGYLIVWFIMGLGLCGFTASCP